jgi:hypothetical protein
MRTLAAVVVGTNAPLDGGHDALRFAEADAHRFADSLAEQDLYEELNLYRFIGGSFRNDEVTAVITEVRESDSADAIVFFFAGHGIVEAADDGGECLYLSVPTVDLDDLEGSAIDLHQLVRDLDERETVCLILDCCFSGHHGGRSILGHNYLTRRQAGRKIARRRLPEFVGEGNLVLAACGRDQKAAEVSALRHGVFTYALCDVLSSQKDASVQVSQAHAAVTRQVLDLTSHQQCPSIHGRDHGAVLPSFRKKKGRR